MFLADVLYCEHSYRFNEAGARMLRKCRGTSARNAPSAGFNEAGARMLRKWSAAWSAMAYKLEASMRPEHGCSGNGLDKQRRSGTSDCFNEAGARMLRKWGWPYSPGPCRHGFNEAGARMLRKCGGFSALHTSLQEASMRPEHGCSGNVRSASRAMSTIP